MTTPRSRKAWWMLLATSMASGLLVNVAWSSEADSEDPAAIPFPAAETRLIEVGEEALPASQRSPVPFIDPAALPYADQYPGLFEAIHHATEALPDDAIPSVTLRTPETIDPPPLDELRIVLDWYPSPHHAALLVAQARGDFERHGLEVILNVPSDPSLPPKLLAASRVDLAVGRQAQLHMLVDKQLPLVRVATLMPTPLSVLVVPADGDIETLSDLEGKIIGHSLDDSVTPLLEGMLAQHDITLDELELMQVNFSLAQALLEGRVDALIAPLRHVLPHHLLEEGLSVRSFAAEAHGIPRHDGMILMANHSVLALQRSELKRLLSALEDATEWIINHPDEAWQLITHHNPGMDTAINQRAWPDTLRRLALRPAALDARRYEALQTYLYKQGYIENRQPLERLAVDLYTP